MADSFAPIAAEARPRHFMPTLLIEALDAARREAEAPPPPPPPPSIEPLLEQARRDGFEEGLAEGLRHAAEAERTGAARTAAIAVEALRLGHDAAYDAATAAAQDVARLMLSVLDAALPGLAAERGAPLAGAFAQRIAPVLRSEPQARLLVPPGLADTIRGLLGTIDIVVAEDPAIPPGDARAEWRSGGAAFDLASRRQAIRQLLESAGLGPKE